MASTFSTSLRLELIGDGDQSGIWGQTTNSNLGTLIEQAITGVVGITMLDANYTISNFNGVADESRNAVLVLSGTNTAQRNLVAPLVEKVYIVKNSTTGGFGVQVIGSSGTGVVIPNGATVSVYCDGTNFYAAQVNTAGSQTINGNLTVTGTTTLSGALTYGGVALSNAVTGTGNMVLSASPTFTGAPLSTTAAFGTNTTQIATTAFVATAISGLNLGTMSTQNANNVAITGGTMSGMTSIGGVNITATGSVTVGSNGSLGPGAIYSNSAYGMLFRSVQASPAAYEFAFQNSTGSANLVTISTGAVVSANGFSGAGTGLTGTAASLTSGATNSVASGGSIASNVTATTQPLGTNNTTIATTAFALANGIPSGAIVMWSGSIASIPSGWLLCNGASGTPDLRDRFVVGAGSTYAVSATGGTADAVVVSHTHTASTTATDSGHVHPPLSPANSYFGGPNSGQSPRGDVAQGTSVSTTGTGFANITASTSISTTGVSGTNQNLPPYYALAYIMKA